MNISVIIPNYNGSYVLKKTLPKAIRSLYAYSKKERASSNQLILIDDASTDDSVNVINAIINKEISEKRIMVTSMSNEKNLGFSSTINKGVMHATGDIVVLLNTDVSTEENFLEFLLMHFSDPTVFAVGCLEKSIESGKIVERGRGVGKWERGFLMHARGEIQEQKTTLWVSGGSGAFRRSIWKKLGGMNELYNPFYWEDIDLSYRALKSGYKLIFERKSVVEHEHELGSIKTRFTKSQIKTIAYRNQFIFVWENATDLSLQLLHILWLPYHFINAFLHGDWHFFMGFFQAVLLVPLIIYTSLKSQEQFMFSDKDVIKQFQE